MRAVRVDTIHSLKPEAWAVRNVVGGLTVLWGPPKTYKTFTAISMAVCVASGRPWLGCSVRKGPVLYILGEGGLELFLRRTSAAAHYMGISVHTGGKDDGPLPLWVVGASEDLSNPANLEKLWEDYDPISPVLVVIDTLSRCLPGDENTQEDMQGFVSACDAFRERYGCSVLVLHHGNKAGEVRGSTVLTGALDVSIKVKKAKGEDGKPHMVLQADQLRDMDPEDFPHSKLLPVTVDVLDFHDQHVLDEYGDKITTVVMTDSPEREANATAAYLVFTGMKMKRKPNQCVGWLEWKEVCELGGMSANDFKRAVTSCLADSDRFDIVQLEPGQYGYRSMVVDANPFDTANHYLVGKNFNAVVEKS